MDPISATLIAGKVVSEGTKMAIPVVKKVIEVAIPVVKQASLITFKFFEGGLREVLDQQKVPCEQIKLSGSLPIVNNELSVQRSFSDNQLKPCKNKVSNDLSIIEGQNEMLFLSNSISYFIESHKNRIGLDRSISYALQSDIDAVREHLKKNRNKVRFPGYLLHQCVSLAETIKELNILYQSIINNGTVPDHTEETARDTLLRVYGYTGRPSKISSYIPFELQFTILKEIADKNKSPYDAITKLNPIGKPQEILGISIDEIEDKAHESLFVLCEELIANEELERDIEKKLKNTGKKLLIEKYSDEFIQASAPKKRRSKIASA